ncbi:MAG: 30S ribosomal protein S12 methylthiotransferase RimO [Elusimicrobia bacterium HGW-Elusimicrobia-1]|jgi:ribosomal protein S12 methylthiotransferase|nr:MAG: 30S ribosomal protein S12 methylthiotransferase RimO [Elusimicrobia bacterium HGW-Elusimicrobia-1]
MKVYIETLGCAKNLTESETLAGRLLASGAELVSEPSAADVLVVHTCSFIGDALDESAAAIHRAARRKSKGSRLIVSGCLAQMSALKTAPDKVASAVAAADVVVGTGRLGDAADVILGRKTGISGMLGAPGGFHDAESRAHPAGSPWAYLRVAEGCGHRCNYCLIPSLRGTYKSRPADDIVREAGRLASMGVKELNLISQDTSGYGLDMPPSRRTSIAGLLGRLEKIRGIEWIRLLYCHPSTISGDMLSVMSASRKIVRYLDVPLQHVSCGVLRAMGRPTGGESPRESVKKLKSRVPGIALRTTFIVGHPGESDKDFRELIDFINEGHFMWTGIFAYSAMSGTVSARSQLPVPSASVVKRRLAAALAAARRTNRRALDSFSGKKIKALVTTPSTARPYFCAPEVDGEIKLRPRSGAAAGNFVSVFCDEVY